MTQQQVLETLSQFPGTAQALSFDEVLDAYTDLITLPPVVLSETEHRGCILFLEEQINSGQVDPSVSQAINAYVGFLKEATTTNEVQARRPNSALSRIAKRRWVRYRQKYKRAMAKYHLTAKNKKFSKAISDQMTNETRTQGPSRQDILELLKAVTSAQTHYIIELEIQERDVAPLSESDYELLDEVLSLAHALSSDLKTCLTLPMSESADLYHDAKTFAQEIFTSKNVVLVFPD